VNEVGDTSGLGPLIHENLSQALPLARQTKKGLNGRKGGVARTVFKTIKGGSQQVEVTKTEKVQEKTLTGEGAFTEKKETCHKKGKKMKKSGLVGKKKKSGTPILVERNQATAGGD